MSIKIGVEKGQLSRYLATALVKVTCIMVA